MYKIKVALITAMSALMGWLGILAVPMLLLVGCNVVDYITGLLAVPNRTEMVSSYKGIRGIIKKVCQWLLVLVGSWIDILINYAIEFTGIDFTLPFIVATIVAVWLVVNEIISILENLLDIGIHMPPFLLPIVKYIKKQVEEKAKVTDEKGGEV